MTQLLHWLSRRRFPYEPLISVEISRAAILGNLSEFKKLIGPGKAIAPVLKSNAYGHGLLEIAGILRTEPDISFFVVDSYFEAVALRARGIRTPILIIGYTRTATIAHSRLRHTAFTITSLEALKALKDCWYRVHIHIKIDTGMHRQGLLPEEVPAAIEEIRDNESIVLEGVCTHFSDADNADSSFTESQIRIWDRVVKQFKSAFPAIRYIHASNTDGSRFSSETTGNVVRLGIGLYGLSENEVLNERVKLKPAMSVKTIVTGLKHIKAGETVGYGNTFKAQRDVTIATIPFGYYEGLDRALSSDPDGQPRGFIQIGDARAVCPIIGRVSMNITIIDVSGVPGVAIGTETVVVSDVTNDPNSLASIAKKAGTIAYEEAVRIPAQLKRVVVH